MIVSEKYRDYRDQVAALVSGSPVLSGRLSVTVAIFPPDKRRRDIDNVAKATLDSLTYAGVWSDDSQVDRLQLIRQPPSDDAHLTVSIAVIPPEDLLA